MKRRAIGVEHVVVVSRLMRKGEKRKHAILTGTSKPTNEWQKLPDEGRIAVGTSMRGSVFI
jgi:hypothetical protein